MENYVLILFGRRIKMAKIISIVNQKGGVGKTTSAVNLVAALGAMGKRVLLIDIDPQGNTTSGYGIQRKGLTATSYELLINSEEAKNAVIKTKYQGVDVIPSNMNLAGAELEMATLEGRESLLKKAIAPIQENYDFVFFDCPPSLGLITINALNASDSFIVPIQCEYYALEGLSQLMATVRTVKRLYNDYLELEGVLLTMYDGRLNLTQQVVDEVKNFFPKKFTQRLFHETYVFQKHHLSVNLFFIMTVVQKVQKATTI